MEQLEFQIMKELIVGIPCLWDGITHNSLPWISVADMKEKANGWRFRMKGCTYTHWPNDSLTMLYLWWINFSEYKLVIQNNLRH